jgi:predicted nucleic acid-binding protein
MRTLLDTNVLLRSCQPNSPDHETALAAVNSLLGAGRTLCIGSQTIYEFLAVATRSIAANGLGMEHSVADAELAKLLVGIEVLYDSESVVAEVRRLVVDYKITGKKIHDAHLAGAMMAHQVNEILTFDSDDFKRLSQITVLGPVEAARGTLPESPP